MLRRLLAAWLGAAIRLFFRRVEVVGRDRVPATGPTLFAINHPNALVDPILLLCFAPRPVSFLGKAPLFRIPVIGWLVRALDTIPVYRRQDGNVDPAQTRATFARARALLVRGGTIAIAPEGTSRRVSGIGQQLGGLLVVRKRSVAGRSGRHRPGFLPGQSRNTN